MPHPAVELYTDLLIRAVSNTIYGDPAMSQNLGKPNRPMSFVPEAREQGYDWPSQAHSMAGLKRLTSLRDLTQRILDEGVPGDLIETGVWRGGCCILMRGILAANGATDRRVWVCDSFEGLPRPDAEAYPADAGDPHHQFPALAIPLDQVRANFAAYGLLDDQVRFVKGFFRDTLPGLDTGPLALIRLDGDMYESTTVALDALYGRLSPGGVVVVDDMALAPCAQAVHDFRGRHGIEAPIEAVDWTGVWWRKPPA